MNSPGNSSFLRAVLILLFAVFLFDVMGIIIKQMSSGYPVQQLSMLRNLFGLIPSIIMLTRSRTWQAAGRPWKLERWKLALLRGAMIVGAQFCFYLSLTRLEFATASTIGFAGPLFVTALSVPLLGNRVGFWRWMAVMGGFSGIVLVMKPGSDIFDWYALLPLLAALGYASSSVTTRLFAAEVETPLINIYSVVSAFVLSTILTATTSGFVPIIGSDLPLLLCMGMAGGTAALLLVTAYRMNDPGNLSPFEYFGIPFSFVLGWIVFSEAPFDRLFPGSILIVAGGLIIVWRERVRTRSPSIA
ncbi:MAG: DMT family transporter [Rhizobiaceae bacterium]